MSEAAASKPIPAAVNSDRAAGYEPAVEHGEKGWGSSYSSPGPDAFYARCRCGEKFYGRSPKVAINRRQRHIDKEAERG